MSAKPRFLCMDKDELVWQKVDDVTDEWTKVIRTSNIYRAVGNLILQYKKGQPKVMHTVVKGGYNLVYRLEYCDGSSTIMRIPIQSIVPAVMRYIAASNTIPVPHVYHYAPIPEKSMGIGPFTIMDYIDHFKNMSRELPDPARAVGERPILDAQISEGNWSSYTPR